MNFFRIPLNMIVVLVLANVCAAAACFVVRVLYNLVCRPIDYPLNFHLTPDWQAARNASVFTVLRVLDGLHCVAIRIAQAHCGES